MKYLDIHTHKERENLRSGQVLSLDIRNTTEVGVQTEGAFSLGIHPWYIGELVLEEAYLIIEEFIMMPNCVSLGELGIDRSIQTSIDQQIEVFRMQVQIAKNYKVNSLTLHCVRAYPEIISIIKKLDYKGSLIFHDYNGHPSQGYAAFFFSRTSL